jgi:esterase/lipase
MTDAAKMAILSQIAYLDMPPDLRGRMPNVTLNDLIEHADIQSHVNKKENKRLFEDALRIIEDSNELKNISITSYRNENGNGSGMVAYCFNSNGNAVFAFRGTEGDVISTSGDGWDNVKSVAVTTQQQKDAKDFVNNTLGANTFKQVYVTGHSLGGSLAQYVTLSVGAVTHCVVFNSKGLNAKQNLKGVFNSNSNKIVNYYNTRDPLIIAQYIFQVVGFPLLRNIGKQVPHTSSGVIMTKDAHFMYHIINEIENKGDFQSSGVDSGRSDSKRLKPTLSTLGKLIGATVVSGGAFAKWMTTAMAASKVIVGSTAVGKSLAHHIFLRFFSAGYGAAGADPVIKVDTDKLKDYASRLEFVNHRLDNIDNRLNSLYKQVGLLGLFNLLRADARIGWNKQIDKSAKYLNDTAGEFEQTERNLTAQLG